MLTRSPSHTRSHAPDSETPIYDVIVGNEEGQVPLRKLNQYLMKLPRNISTGEMDSLEARLAASGRTDEHGLRDLLVRQPASRPLERVTVQAVTRPFSRNGVFRPASEASPAEGPSSARPSS
mgnify:CR=1 FL=1